LAITKPIPIILFSSTYCRGHQVQGQRWQSRPYA